MLESGLGEAWYNQGVGNETLFIVLLKQRLRDINSQDWQGRLNESTRAHFYRSIVPSVDSKSYLNTVNIKSHRIALTRLRVSSHNLRVETGRWERPVILRNERLCPACNNKLEDEFHFIFECKLYEHLRKRLLPRYYWQHPLMSKLLELFNTDKHKLIRALAKFVHLASLEKKNHFERMR